MMLHSVLLMFIGSGTFRATRAAPRLLQVLFRSCPSARRRTSKSVRLAGKTQRIVGPRPQIVVGTNTLPTSISYQCPGPELATKVKRPARLNEEPSVERSATAPPPARRNQVLNMDRNPLTFPVRTPTVRAREILRSATPHPLTVAPHN